MNTLRRCLLVILALGLAACASATKRYEQGLELEMSGRYDEASHRYVQALQKDPSLVEVRAHLKDVSQRAIEQRVADAESWSSRGKTVAAASEYQQIDGIVARSKGVGVRLDLEADHDQKRRSYFDRATEDLLQQSEASLDRAQWAPAVNTSYRAATEFEPSLNQSDRALEVHSSALLGWSYEELEHGHLQAAYARAQQVQGVSGCPTDIHAEAEKVMYTALAQGQVELLALPVMAYRSKEVRTRGKDDQEALRKLEIEVNDAMERGPWRAVSPFVHMTNPIRVREIVRQAERLQGQLRAPALGLIVQLTDADFGAWLELEEVNVTEFEVRQTERTVNTRDGQPATYLLEEGKRRMQVEARVIVIDAYGNAVSDLKIVGQATAPFRQGTYDGDPSKLNLSRRDVDAFDELALEAQDQALRRLMAEDLSGRLAGAVLEPVMARIP